MMAVSELAGETLRELNGVLAPVRSGSDVAPEVVQTHLISSTTTFGSSSSVLVRIVVAESVSGRTAMFSREPLRASSSKALANRRRRATHKTFVSLASSCVARQDCRHREIRITKAVPHFSEL